MLNRKRKELQKKKKSKGEKKAVLSSPHHPSVDRSTEKTKSGEREREREVESAEDKFMATLQSWRKAYGALKDTTKVGLANLNSDYKELDVAIVKATNHVECPPKERHFRKILAATSAVRPRADVAYCIHALARRLAKTHNWTVALKTLIVIHRALRDGDPTFREELLNFSQRARILQLSNFKDDSGPIAWDCSAWVRTYALFLEERLECFRVLRYDVESERLTKPAPGDDKGHSRFRDLESEELLEQLPALQQLLYRLIGCLPEGAAVSNYVIQYALALVLKESFKIYCAINDGIINLVDKFFEMPRHEAVKALEVYKRAGQQEFPERLLLTYKPEETPVSDDDKPSTDEPVSGPVPVSVSSEVETSAAVAAPPAKPLDTGDLLGLNMVGPDASAIEESNALALAIVPSASDGSNTVQEKGFDPSGWELALVPAPSSNVSAVNESKLVNIGGPLEASDLRYGGCLDYGGRPEISVGRKSLSIVLRVSGGVPKTEEITKPEDAEEAAGGFDKLILDSLYDEATYRAQQPSYGAAPPNPFMAADPFAMSNYVAAPTAVQMAAQQQQMSTMMQPNPFGAPFYQQPQPQPQPHMMYGSPSNPFGDTGFGAFPVNPPHQSNPFGNTGLL
ncbi:putative clathrin assembly protein [Acorus calamus]|uniref:Clathrin assembly protein n=1 Tax=Acorus calamus TaxID=4465 RepID=A0AAV9F965_ACOCL|nr:putative clathrin assembly protein [Acorus calamus]